MSRPAGSPFRLAESISTTPPTSLEGLLLGDGVLRGVSRVRATMAVDTTRATTTTPAAMDRRCARLICCSLVCCMALRAASAVPATDSRTVRYRNLERGLPEVAEPRGTLSAPWIQLTDCQPWRIHFSSGRPTTVGRKCDFVSWRDPRPIAARILALASRYTQRTSRFTLCVMLHQSHPGERRAAEAPAFVRQQVILRAEWFFQQQHKWSIPPCMLGDAGRDGRTEPSTIETRSFSAGLCVLPHVVVRRRACLE